MAAVELVCDQPDAAPGAVVGAVDIINEQLVTVASTVVTAHEGPPLALPPGRYLAQGRLPSGRALRAVFDASMRRVVLPGERRSPPGGRVPGWVLGWQRSGRKWSPSRAPVVSGSDTPIVELTPPASTGTVALQLGAFNSPAHFTVVPTDIRLRVHLSDDRLVVTPPPGIESTLLTYLHCGDVGSAHTVAEQALTVPPQETTSLLDITLGYYLLRTDHPAANDWIRDLAYRRPDSVDAIIINASMLMRTSGTSDEAIGEELIRAAWTGLPVVARGLQLLASGLAAMDQNDIVAACVDRLRPYRMALLDSPQTAFFADRPDQPLMQPTGPTSPATATPFVLGLSPAPPARPRPMTVVAPQLLQETLDLLETRGIGNGPGHQVVDIPDLVLEATITQNAEHLDLHLVTTPAVAEQTVSVRAGATLHCLGRFDDDGRCTITAVPPGRWTLDVRHRPARSRLSEKSVPLPLPDTALALRASTTNRDTVEVMRTLTPHARTLLVLRRNVSDGYVLELSTRTDDTLTVLGVEYTRNDGDTATRLVPLSTSSGLSSASLRLDDFDVREPWQVDEHVDLEQVENLSAQELEVSVRSSRHARQGWLGLAGRLAHVALAAVIRSMLEEPMDH